MKKTWLIGAGIMAKDYAKVLNHLNIDYRVIGRGEESARNFTNEIGKYAHSGGLDNFLKANNYVATEAIIAVNVEQLKETAIRLINVGVKKILLEKPGGINLEELVEIKKNADQNLAKVYIAYNRRFYQSIKLAKEVILKDGGISSVHFEFTEWIHTIDQNIYDSSVLNKFLVANSSHVIDTVFHLAGRPKKINCIIKGNAVNWHPSGSIFCGSGLTVNDIPFTYHSNWGAPGRWAIEVLTSKHRIYFKPMERLAIQEMGSIKVTELEENYDLDINFKPGLYLQTKAFLEEKDTEFLCSIEEHYANFKYYEKMAGYNQ
jgi:predicted dehydrogenase